MLLLSEKVKILNETFGAIFWLVKNNFLQSCKCLIEYCTKTRITSQPSYFSNILLIVWYFPWTYSTSAIFSNKRILIFWGKLTAREKDTFTVNIFQPWFNYKVMYILQIISIFLCSKLKSLNADVCLPLLRLKWWRSGPKIKSAVQHAFQKTLTRMYIVLTPLSVLLACKKFLTSLTN